MSDPLTRTTLAARNVATAPELAYASPDGSNGIEPIPATPQRNWIAATIPVAIIAAFAELALAIINNELTIYFPRGIGLNTVVMTNVMAPFFISEIIFKGPLGILADKWGRKPLMVIGPAISIFTPLALIAIHYPQGKIAPLLLILFGFLRLLDGLGAAALWPAMFAYVGDNVPQDKRASAMSLLNVTYMLGLAFGFLAGGWVNDTFGPVLSGKATLRVALSGVYTDARNNIQRRAEGFRHMRFPRMHEHHGLHHFDLSTFGGTKAAAAAAGIQVYQPAQFWPSFYLASALFALATIVAVLALRDRKRGQPAPENVASTAAAAASSDESVSWASFVDAIKSVPHLMTIAVVAFMGMGCIMFIVKNFALDELGISETTFGLLVLGPAIVIGALAIPLGRISDKVGKVVAIRAGFMLATAAMFSLVILNHFPEWKQLGFMIGASMLGVGFVTAFPAWMALLTTIGGDARRGTIVGAVSTGQGIGAIIGVEIGGWLYSHGSRNPHIAHGAPFFASGILLGAATLLTFLLIHGRNGEPAGNEPEALRNQMVGVASA